jgi:hypothetical protein
VEEAFLHHIFIVFSASGGGNRQRFSGRGVGSARGAQGCWF